MGEAKRRKKLDANYGVVPKCRKSQVRAYSKSSAKFKNLDTLFGQLPKDLENLKKIEDVILQVKQNPQRAFVVTADNLEEVSEFIWCLGQRELEVRFFCYADNPYSMTVWICEQTYNLDCNYVYIRKSTLSNKWQIIGQPPGAFEKRCLAVYEDRDKAIEVKNLIVDEVRQFKPDYWDSFTLDETFLDFLNRIPEDDDQVAPIPGYLFAELLSQTNPDYKSIYQEFKQ